ncbi:MAG: YlxR family protein [Dermatophilaceae bacterium]
MGTDRTGLRATQPATPGHREPVRTCIGCRRKDSWSVLVRVVAVKDETGTTQIVPDPRQRMPGRGAWLHPSSQCFENAVRRRAFVRALRVAGAADVTAVTAYLETASPRPPTAPPRTRPEGGSDADEHPMRTQR